MHYRGRSRQGGSPAQRQEAGSPGAIRGPAAAEALRALQRLVGNAAVARLMAEDEPEMQGGLVHEVLRSPGTPLAPGVRADMEARLGADFSGVRVHTDTAADESARAVDAHAYTSGPHIVFQRGRYDPSSPAGQRMLAHELTHVVQQRSGPVDGTHTGDGLQVSDPSDRFEREAEAVAAHATSAVPPVQRAAGSAAPTADDVALQRTNGESSHEGAATAAPEGGQQESEEVTPEEVNLLRTYQRETQTPTSRDSSGS